MIHKKTMDKQYIKNTPLDYSDDRLWVYFEIGGINPTKRLRDSTWMLERIDFIGVEDIKEVDYGFNLHICIQHIPEVVKILEKENCGVSIKLYGIGNQLIINTNFNFLSKKS